MSKSDPNCRVRLHHYFWVALGLTGCRRVDQQVDGVGCALLCLYALLCAIQFAIPAIHKFPQFAEFRRRSLPYARGLCIGLAAYGLFLALSALWTPPRFPTIAWGSAALTLASAFWILQWSYTDQKDEQAKYAKLTSLTFGVLSGLWFLAVKGPKFVPGLF